MIKKILLGFKLLLIFVACNNNKLISQNSNSTGFKKDSSQIETIPKFNLVEISKKEYLELYKKKEVKKFQVMDTTKKNGVVNIQLSNGIVKNYYDTIIDTDKTFIGKHSLVGYYPDIDFFLIMIEYYETSKYILISKKTGQEFEVWSFPVISPNNKIVLTFGYSLAYPLTPNGIQCFEANRDELELLWEFKTYKWEPRDIIWLNDKELLLEQSYPDFNTNISKEKYFKIFLQ